MSFASNESVSWYKDGELLHDDRIYHMESFEETHCFEIKDFVESDEGTYTCIAQNSEGKTTRHIQLFFKGSFIALFYQIMYYSKDKYVFDVKRFFKLI